MNSTKVPKDLLKTLRPYDKSLGPVKYCPHTKQVLYPYVKIKYTKIIKKGKSDKHSPMLQILLYLQDLLKKDGLLVNEHQVLNNFNQCHLMISKSTEEKWLEKEYKWNLNKYKNLYKKKTIRQMGNTWLWSSPSIRECLPIDIVYLPEEGFQTISDEQLLYEI